MAKIAKLAAAALTLVLLLAPANANAKDSELDAAHAEVKALHAKTAVYIDEQQFEKALRNAKQAYALAQDTLGKDHETTAVLGFSLANILGAVSSRNEAVWLYKLSLKRYEKIYGNDAYELIPVLASLSKLQSEGEQVDTVERALSLHKTHRPDDALEFAKLAARTGGYLALDKKTSKQAIYWLGEAKTVYEAEYGEKSPELIPVLMSLGDANARYLRTTKQKQNYRQAIKIARSTGDKEKYADVLHTAGINLMGLSASADAKTYLLRAHRLYTKIHGPDHVVTANAKLSLARYNSATGEYRRALPQLQDALAVFEQNDNYRNRQMSTLTLLVSAYENMGASEKATPYCQAVGKISPWTDNQEYRPLYKRPPTYPKEAIKQGKEGFVTLNYTVDEYGFVTSPTVSELQGPESFVTAAMDAAGKFRYAPRFIEGKAVSTPNVKNRFTFKLAN